MHAELEKNAEEEAAARKAVARRVSHPKHETSGDTTPCKVSPVIPHGVVFPGVTLHSKLYAISNQWHHQPPEGNSLSLFQRSVSTENCSASMQFSKDIVFLETGVDSSLEAARKAVARRVPRPKLKTSEPTRNFTTETRNSTPETRNSTPVRVVHLVRTVQ